MKIWSDKKSIVKNLAVTFGCMNILVVLWNTQRKKSMTEYLVWSFSSHYIKSSSVVTALHLCNIRITYEFRNQLQFIFGQAFNNFFLYLHFVNIFVGMIRWLELITTLLQNSLRYMQEFCSLWMWEDHTSECTFVLTG